MPQYPPLPNTKLERLPSSSSTSEKCCLADLLRRNKDIRVRLKSTSIYGSWILKQMRRCVNNSQSCGNNTEKPKDPTPNSKHVEFPDEYLVRNSSNDVYRRMLTKEDKKLVGKQFDLTYSKHICNLSLCTKVNPKSALLPNKYKKEGFTPLDDNTPVCDPYSKRKMFCS
ncbi:hypothetical protein CEXT_530551 [Caerostris extrusa]|uniref:Uncharacterized protein n=1 Tax=Caerostris extrusa TaxID=172846 RepID=A0AAV4TA46_CAEEX|nr:hypothetical protein CEXT_530551 [Caerostris extrusa]